MRKSRLDILKLDGAQITQQGFLKFPVYAGRTGIQIYKDAEGNIIKEFRPADEVFGLKTMDSLKNVPVTNEHPVMMVNAKNSKELMVGFGSDQVEIVDNKFQKTFVTITDQSTIEDIQNGKVEVSLGYDLEMDMTPGVFEGQEYDAIQRNIVVNHLAVVQKGRAGEDVRLRLDRYDAIMIEDAENNLKSDKCKLEDQMEKIKIGDQEFEVEKKLKDAFNEFMKGQEKKSKDAEEEKEKAEKAKDEEEEKAKDAEEEKKKAEEKADSLQGKLDAADETIEKLKKTSKVDSATILNLVKERKTLEDVASKVLDDETLEKMDDMESIDIKKAVISANTKKEINLDGKSEIYINARFDGVADSLDVSSEANKKAGESFKNRKDGGDKTLEDKRTESMKKDSDAWKQPIGKHIKEGA